MKSINTVQGRLQRLERLRKNSAQWPKIETALKAVFNGQGTYWEACGDLKHAILSVFAGSKEFAPLKMHDDAWTLANFVGDVAKRKSVDADGRSLPTCTAFTHRLGMKL